MRADVGASSGYRDIACMNNLKSFDAERVQRIIKRFARQQGLSTDDPIVKTLASNVKMRLGYRRWKNGRNVEQPSLFDKASVVEFKPR